MLKTLATGNAECLLLGTLPRIVTHVGKRRTLANKGGGKRRLRAASADLLLRPTTTEASSWGPGMGAILQLLEPHYKLLWGLQARPPAHHGQA